VPYKTVGLAGSASYGYLNRYLLDFSASYTGSENFASGHRFGFFPAVSAGWIVSDEDFLKNNPALSFLKLRASYGAAGLDRPISDRFLYRENWGSANGYGFGTNANYQGGTDQLRLGNDNLKWETSYKSNIGLDFGFMNNSLLWTIDGFIDNRKDILVQKYATTPAMAGLALPYENAGETKSWGFDTEFTFDKQLSKYFRLTIKANAMLTRSKIININETFKVDAYQYAAGNPISQPFGYVNQGLFTQEEITRRGEGNLTDAEKALGYDVIQNGGNLRAGDIKYTDLNGDKKIDGRDTRPIGGSGVPNLIGGLDLGFKYRQFDFTAQLMGMGQRWLYIPGSFRSNFNGGGNATLYALQAWTPETSETAIYPRLSVSNNSNNQQYSDFWFRDASFIRLKTLEIGYNIPSKILNVVGINKTRFYANGYNLFTFDKVNDFDPENTEAAFSRYPYKRIITLGVSVTF
jgi:TonB-linked SusC/RagA family outer membrane protein